jgi:hypothetical protein
MSVAAHAQFLTVSKHVGDMLDKLPALADQSNAFLAAAPAIAHKRKVNLHILQVQYGCVLDHGCSSSRPAGVPRN